VTENTDRAAANVIVKNLPPRTTPTEVSNFFLEKIGLDVPVENIGCVGMTDSTYAFVALTRETMAAFLNRYLEGQLFQDRIAVKIEAKKPRRRHNSAPVH